MSILYWIHLRFSHLPKSFSKLCQAHSLFQFFPTAFGKCPQILKTKIKVKSYNNGQKEIKEKEYHKQINVVAKIVGKKPGLILDYEKVTDEGKGGKQDYEPHVGTELIKRLNKSYGRGIDILVLDAIYLNKNVIKEIKANGYDGVIRLKDNNKSLIENADGLFKTKKPKEWKTKRKVVNTNVHQSRKIKAYSDIFEYAGNKVKVVKYEESYKKSGENQIDIIYVLSTDTNLSEETINKIMHARWDIENNGFNELKNNWNMKHCYIAEDNAIDVMLEMIIMSYNLWEIYLYGHLHDFCSFGTGYFWYILKMNQKYPVPNEQISNFYGALYIQHGATYFSILFFNFINYSNSYNNYYTT